jgi:hypothetical protein
VAAGGYQRPSNPAPVGMPGALSQRTDGGPTQPMVDMPSAGYGEQAEFQALQGGAPMAGVEQVPMGPPPTPLAAPTGMPNVPVTDGLPFGPGAGPSGQNPVAISDERDMQMLAKYLPQFQSMASGDDVPASYLRFLTSLRSYL